MKKIDFISLEMFCAVIGAILLFALLGIGSYIAFRRKQDPIPFEAMIIFRVILALSAAAFAAVLPGVMEIEGNIIPLKFRAAGAIAIFLLVYLFDPPERLERHLSNPKKKHHNPKEEKKPLEKKKQSNSREKRSDQMLTNTPKEVRKSEESSRNQSGKFQDKF